MRCTVNVIRSSLSEHSAVVTASIPRQRRNLSSGRSYGRATRSRPVSAPSPTLLSLPALAVAAHLVEEFVWPGGFGNWYRAYRPARASSVTTGYLVRINALFFAIALLPAILSPSPYAVAFWLVVASIGVSNAAFHLYASWTRRRYSPGVVTGVLVYLPLALVGYREFIATGAAPMNVIVQAVLIGPAFHLWSAVNHRRRASVILSEAKDLLFEPVTRRSP